MSEERLHPNLALDRRGPIEVLRVDREEALGALNFETMEALGTYVQGLYGRRDEVRVLMLTGTGRGFVAGADIAGYHGAGQTVFDGFQRRSRQTFDAIAGLPQATICAVNGYALGGGFELAMCCDFIFVNEKTKLGLPEIKLGLLPGGGGTQRLPRLVGAMRAKELLMTGRMITAAEAVEYGAALEACAPEALMPRALEFAESLATMAPVALSEAKRVVDDGLDTALSAGLTMEQRVLGALFATEDGKEGIAAFMEKRDPDFKGQ
ncbi:enoyl-CoA hydratase/isomerase family protein [Roseobacter sp. HKCCD9010]|uniref:enoyl-CoA hydratase/isomerase family protein n=1 Tax=unclassified Roseobacter TaxID=196798 RepID=UPI00149165FD|nr:MULTISPECIES: enoyl-CoA hydratase-related protein [unclassified Roseobacter]MBF9052112.1 enoyl-CoA hydratase/isomerase family protein [Rhodobacterales bacterium HKCCD4356]NNV14032.1 enoyl-CoA hydratase/isomerase family protein [Roseobacter sp. HKCCD7357]NNV18294.1 enoyl-CoA hydratase/isomerase family protein [Roseobacter sp. HKCCD8768]NNV27731.1 enoyl-CoA hydratase/isomerase family protein [Roseobacter sp. HKCCD8192]NNV32006.1 enoyl-CoA hydratase/isomerase family protein [Roseobacter sp. HK